MTEQDRPAIPITEKLQERSMDAKVVTVKTETMVRAVLVVLATWIAVLIIVTLATPLTWILVAAFLAIGLTPVVEKLQRRLWGKRGLALGMLSLATILVFVLVGSRLVPALVYQTQEIIEALPQYQTLAAQGNNPLAQLVDRYNLIQVLENSKDKILAFFTASFGTIFTGAAGLLTGFFTTLTFTAYFIIGGPEWIETLKKSRLSRQYRHHEKTLELMGAAISNYVIGNLLTSGFAMATSFVVMVLLGIPTPLPLSFLYGVFDIIPIVGATLGGIMLVVIALFQSTTAAVIMVVFIILYQQLETVWIQPRVYGRALNLPNVVVLIAAILGGTLAGLIGALLAIPLAACVRVAIIAYFDRNPPLEEKDLV
jgi:predicted PurR-regulated permease PerM